jgi:hypothetical protein
MHPHHLDCVEFDSPCRSHMFDKLVINYFVSDTLICGCWTKNEALCDVSNPSNAHGHETSSGDSNIQHFWTRGNVYISD